jgi:hypothetical protein
METILVVNAGSSSLKFQVFALAGEGEQRFWPQLSRDPDPFRTEETSSRVIDTSQRMLAPVIAVQDDSPAAPGPVVMPDSRIRESSAQLVPPSNRQTSASEPKKPERNPLPKRKVSSFTSSIQQFMSPSIRTLRPIGEPRDKK